MIHNLYARVLSRQVIVTAPPTKVGGFQSLATQTVQPHSCFSMVSPLREVSVGSDFGLPDSVVLLPASEILPGGRLPARTVNIRLSRG